MTTTAPLKSDVRWRFEQYIGGTWRPSVSGKRREVIDPATATVVGDVADGGIADVEAAVACARTAFDEGRWAGLDVRSRVRALQPAVDYLVENQEALLEAEIAECGSPIRTASGLHVGFALAHSQYFLDVAPSLRLEQPLGFHSPPFSVSHVVREPEGVVAAITPFNFPFLLAVWKVFPALLMGNSVVLKPNPRTPLSAMLLAEALSRTDLPPGQFNVVTGDVEVGQYLVESPLVDHVTFTGSTGVGRSVAAGAAQTLKNVTLELGGKSPSVILPDADFDLVVDGVLFGVNFYAGQCCEAGSRVFVPRGREDELIDRLVRRAATIRLGDTRNPETDLGPVISAEKAAELERLVNDAAVAGATVACGGRRAEIGDGYFFQPTVVHNLTNDTSMARQELFGPVLSVIGYDSVDEAVRLANDTIYGLAATVWSTSMVNAYDISRRLRAGTVWINDHHQLRPDAPFGGYRQSGIGRELGEEGFFDFTETKHVYMSLTNDRQSRFWSLALPAEE
ncbi:aldehyde dehydrogenase family protein [Mycobacterium avium subsp. hominissuis]